ncbi:hypothetical protein SAY86_006046 [Trapa natans]|uniref:ABC-type xenobiotic transporter n=1 Tax=Trapa natans TaxID=22666 RepID=A0AAN7QXA4_TRANT|nr:hypothetical protein SAY86_006046 [Trapa natans]
MMSSGSNCLFQAVFLHSLSASLHLVLLLGLLVWWVCWRFSLLGRALGCKGGLSRVKVLYYRVTPFCCLGLSVLNFVLCLLSHFYWYRNGWSDEKAVSMADLAVRAVSWAALCIYLHARLSGFCEPNMKFPVLLRVWWGLFLSLSCYCLVVDFLLQRQYHVPLPIRSFIFDGVSVLSGLFFCYVGLLGKYEGENVDAHLEEPLINGAAEDSSSGNSKGSETETPYSEASVFSKFTFSWMSPLIAFGNQKALDPEDVPQLDFDDSLEGAFPKFKSKLQTQLASGPSDGVTTSRLVKALISYAWKEILITALCALTYTVASYIGPYLIDAFVQYLSGRRAFNGEGYFLVSAFLFGKFAESVSQRQWFFRLQRLGIRARAVIVGMIYDKGLTLSCHSKQGHTSGEIINFMSVDAERIEEFVWCMHSPWMVLLQVTLALIILFKNLGLAAIASLVTTVLVMLANLPLASLEEKYQDGLMKSKDKRMKATSEILRNMRILKLQAWAMKFLSKIRDLRETEEGWLKKYVYTDAVMSFVFWGSPTFVSVATFGVCMLMGIPLESGKILSALATFRILQESIYNLPDTISVIIQTKVSLDRIASFLRLDELQKDEIERLPPGTTDIAVEISGGNFSWDSSSSSLTLKDINLKECLLDLLSTKTVIYVTHQVEFLPSANLILVMKDGKITEAGNYNDIHQAGTDFMDLVAAHKIALLGLNSMQVSEESGGSRMKVEGGITKFPEKKEIGQVQNAESSEKSRQLIQEEEREKGRVGFPASTDQSELDTSVPYLVVGIAFSIIQLLGIIGVMSQVAWEVFIVFIPILSVSIWYQQYYIAAARELSRLVGVCNAPLIQHFSETIAGSAVIRSFDQEPRFCRTNVLLSDGYSRPKFYIGGAMEWLCFRLDVLSSFVFGFSLVFLVYVPMGFIHPAMAGLAVTYGLNLNMLQDWVIWSLCTMENKIISVERILQYTTIPSEPPLVIESSRPECSWPSNGEIVIENLQVRYAPHMPLVLRGISCTFEGGMKTGIVGRTGSGKSTFIQTLFRIVDPVEGHIIIDGIDICSIGVHDLRSRLSIIPQDPTMFEGTVRSNIDPLEEYTEEQIWEALDKCQLGDEVRKKEGKLDSAVTENGENWSMGQRQLVCLGRVLLKKSKVLVLDEATASVDTATDNLIQQTLREHFSTCTVITIAHRITSILDSDSVLLLDHGLVCEQGPPKRLLEDKSSSFSQLVAEYTMRSDSSSSHIMF